VGRRWEASAKVGQVETKIGSSQPRVAMAENADRENTVMGRVTTSVKSIVSVVIHESLPDEANSLVIGHCLCGN
jgi:hypothetical protein